jgi:hypothetical protein
MCVRRIDQNSATPIDTLQRFRHVHPICRENNDVARSRLLPGPGDGAWTNISDKISQCLRTSGIGYDHGMTSADQMAAERTRYSTGAYKTYSHDRSPVFGWPCEGAALELTAALSRASLGSEIEARQAGRSEHEGRAALIEPSEFDWSEAKLGCDGRDSCAGIGVIARNEHNLPLPLQGGIRSKLCRPQMIEGFYVEPFAAWMD